MAQEVFAERADSEKPKMSQEMDARFKYYPVAGIAIVFLAYLFYQSCKNNAGSLIVIRDNVKEEESSESEEEKPVEEPKKKKVKKVKKNKNYVRKDNEIFFKELDEKAPYEDSAEKEGFLETESLLKLLSVINYRTFSEFHERKYELFN